MIDSTSELAVLAIASFGASAFSAVFGIGAGIIIVLLLSLWLPLQSVVPIIALCTTAIDSIRSVTFRAHIEWGIAAPFFLGAMIGALLGSRVFFEIPEAILGTGIALIMLSALWLPRPNLKINVTNPFVYVGVLHAFVSAIFAFGGILQAAMARLPHPKETIIGTIAACFAGMSLMKSIGYAMFGFDYAPHTPIVVAVIIGAIPGVVLGRFLGRFVSQRGFDIVFRLIVTAFAIRLLVQSIN